MKPIHTAGTHVTAMFDESPRNGVLLLLLAFSVYRFYKLF